MFWATRGQHQYKRLQNNVKKAQDKGYWEDTMGH